MAFELNTPIVWVIYKRADLTQRVFEAIRDAKPIKLFIAADAPKHESEIELCDATRSVIEQVDWDCELHVDIAEKNLGLQQRVVTAINWAFESVDEMIFLEDDTLPHPSFFRFCQEMLAYYRDNPRMMHISGNNFQPPKNQVHTSYFFSQYPHYWGWATWKRAWKLYDVTMQVWRNATDKTIFQRLLNDEAAWYFWHRRWNRVCSGELSSYSYPWIFTCLLHGGLAIEPRVNLVTNIGFGTEATHTKNSDDPLANYPVAPMQFPLIHPDTIEEYFAADTYKVETFFYPH